MWMLSFIPDSLLQLIVYCIMGGGIGLYAASVVLNFVPTLRAWREPVRVAGTALAVVGVYFFGSYSTEMTWRERVKAVEEKLKIAEEQSAKTNVVIKEKIVYKTKVVEQKVVEYVDRVREIAHEVDAKCEIDPRVIQEINNSSQDPNKESK